MNPENDQQMGNSGNVGMKQWVIVLIVLLIVSPLIVGSPPFFFYSFEKKKYGLLKLSTFIYKGNLYSQDSDYGLTPLHYAVEWGDMEAIRIFLNAGVNVDIRSEERTMKSCTYCTPLQVAVWHNNLEIAKFLISKGADVNAKDGNGFSPIHSAAQNPKNEEILLLLIKNGADVNTENVYGITPLQIANKEKADITNILIANGANCNANDNAGDKTLDAPGKSGEFIEKLKKLGINVYENRKNTPPPLHRASRSGNIEAVKFLAQHHAYVNKTDSSGHTPLYYAKLSGDKNVIQFLEENRGKE